ncbi:MAG TPA: AAA family ATPase [Myxococcota bacterium]|nr:AAA family ATPase [Myxococcota bacterium]HQK52338.1 AAA family ATPase [Myxococcota bacterium]
METIAVYGKGGIGKSVVATSLSAWYAMNGQRVLHVGCDPKHDSALRLLDQRTRIRTVLEVLRDDPEAAGTDEILTTGRHGIACCEAGGPEPGVGCAGRGVARMIETLDEMQLLQSGRFDIAVFDVLGDVVCGGFAAPLRDGFARKVLIVLSEEPMAIFAANNIARAIHIYRNNGVCLAGLVVNRRSNTASTEMLDRFARRLGTRILEVIERDPRIQEAETEQQTILEYAPDAPASRSIARLGQTLLEIDPDQVALPSPMSEEEFFEFLRSDGR